MIKEKIKSEMMESMRAKDNERLTTIRGIIAKIKDKEIEMRTSESKPELDETGVLVVMQQMIKQRNDSILEFKKANRLDLSEKEEKEILVIRSFMPQLLSEPEIEKVIKEAIANLEAQSVKDMGKVVQFMKENYVGRIDPAEVSKKIKELLS
jgi:uncharacterized protein YqeY